jgi:carbonic anhydrase/acetyltransferase-like protein (isoleucine patch superfamily)
VYNDFTIENYLRKVGMQVGHRNRIQIRDFGPEPYLIKIGNHCTISSNVAFLTHDGGTWLFTDNFPSLQKFGMIEIRDNCFIGWGASILPNVKIGPNSIVGAGSVVTKDVPPNTIVVGNPARFIETVDDYRRKVLKTWEEQKPTLYFSRLEEGVAHSPQRIHWAKEKDANLLKHHLLNILVRDGK